MKSGLAKVKGSLRSPVARAIGGPWLLIPVAIAALAGVGIALARKRRTSNRRERERLDRS